MKTFKNLIQRNFKLFFALITISATTLIFGFKPHSSISNQAVINADKEILTVINVITPKEGQQEKIVALLQKGMTQTMRYQKGFISANIHKSMDSEHIIVYAQWKDANSLQEAVKLIEAGKAPSMLEVFSNSTPDYHPYDVISVNLAADKE